VKRSTSTNGPFASLATGLTGTNYTDSTIASGTTYFYVVCGFNLNGESTNSIPVSAAAGELPQNPPPVTASLSQSGTQLILAWPSWAANFDLYTATNLAAPADWVRVTNDVSVDPKSVTINLPIGAGNAFFRLQGK
jgi:endoglucanase